MVLDGAGTRLLVLQHEGGRCYLPGGRVEDSEEGAQALVREIWEECGAQAEVGQPVHQAEHVILDGAVSLEAHYWRAALHGAPLTSEEHVLLWLTPEEACARLHRSGDVEAVRLACGLPQR